MKTKMHRPNRLAGLLVLFLVLQLACSLSGSKKEDATSTPKSFPTGTHIPTRTPRPTLTPLPQATDTPLPTDTPLVLPSLPPTAELTAEATAQPTQASTGDIAKIEPYLTSYGFSTNQGHLAWSSDGPVSLKLETYRESQFEMAADGQVFTDFIFQADITWQSKYGWIACGLVFRSDPNLERGAQYQYIIGRGAPWLGKNYWDIEYHNNGKFVSNPYNDIFNSDAIDDSNGATNTLTIVVQGNQLTPYINSQEQKSTDDSNQLEGTVAFYGWQESGETTCTFDNAWVWVID
jgi:hypothetical protein